MWPTVSDHDEDDDLSCQRGMAKILVAACCLVHAVEQGLAYVRQTILAASRLLCSRWAARACAGERRVLLSIHSAAHRRPSDTPGGAVLDPAHYASRIPKISAGVCGSGRGQPLAGAGQSFSKVSTLVHLSIMASLYADF